MEKDITQKRVWNTKDMVTAVSIAVTITFAVTMIWGRFLFIETQVGTVDDRYRKVTDRMILRIEKLENTVNNEHK